MNILNLKRSAYGHRFLWNDRGTDGTGTGNANTGGADSGGMGGVSSGGGGSSSNGGGSRTSLGLSDYGALADSYTGYNPTTGYTSTVATAPGIFGGNNYGYSPAQPTSLSLKEAPSTANLDALKATLQDIPGLGFLSMLPGVTAATNVARLVATVQDALTPSQMATFRTGTGLTEADVAGARDAVATGRDGTFGVVGGGGGGGGGGNLLGFTSGAGGATAPAGGGGTSPLGDIFSIFGVQNPGAASAFTPPEFDGDPSGMVAGGKQFMQDYQRDYAPYAAKLRGEVDRIGTPEFLAQERSRAMADVQSQYDNTMQQNMRGMARMGVNPSSGRTMAMQNQGAIQNAAAKVGAAAKAEGMVRTNYMAGLGAVNTMGTDFAKMGQGWANLGVDAAKTKSGYGLGVAELGLKSTAQNQSNAVSWGQIGANKYATDKGLAGTQMRVDSATSDAREANLWGVAGLAAQSFLSPSKTNWWDT